MVSISLLVAVSIMVFLGLLSGLNTRRCPDPKPLPFQEGKPVRRAFRRNVKSEKIKAALRETGATLLSEETPHIYGCADLSVGFAYSHAVRLGELEREQYFYWRSMGVSASDLWCFRVAQHSWPSSTLACPTIHGETLQQSLHSPRTRSFGRNSYRV